MAKTLERREEKTVELVLRFMLLNVLSVLKVLVSQIIGLATLGGH